MRLIDVDRAELYDVIGRNAFKTRDDIRYLIDIQPTVDAVPVVRCRDCSHRNKILCPMIHETLGNGLIDYTTDDGYCDRGKRKGKI